MITDNCLSAKRCQITCNWHTLVLCCIAPLPDFLLLFPLFQTCFLRITVIEQQLLQPASLDFLLLTIDPSIYFEQNQRFLLLERGSPSVDTNLSPSKQWAMQTDCVRSEEGFGSTSSACFSYNRSCVRFFSNIDQPHTQQVVICQQNFFKKQETTPLSLIHPSFASAMQ